VQVLEIRAGLNPELAGEPLAHIAEHAERVTAPSAPVQRHHQHPGQPLRERVPGQQGGQLPGGLLIPPQLQQGGRAVLPRRQALLGQPGPDRLDPGRVRHVGQRRPPP